MTVGDLSSSDSLRAAAARAIAAQTKDAPAGQIRENPSKRLGSSPTGDTPNVAVLQSFHSGYDQGRRDNREKCRAQKRELRRLNRVIQQMSWKLHVKNRSIVIWRKHRVTVNGYALVLAGAAAAIIIAMLVF